GGGIIKALTENGVSEVFAIVSSLDLRQPHESFFIVLPVAKGKSPQDVIDAVSKVAGGPPPHELPIVNNAILIGPPDRLDKLKEIKSAPRADLAKALAASKSATIQVAAALHDDMRRVLAETVDQLPKELGGGSG